MFGSGNNDGGAARPSFLARTKEILANPLGGVVAFFGTPIGYSASQPFVVEFTQQYYWTWLAYPASWALFAAIALLLFGLTRLVFAHGLSLAESYFYARRG